MSTNDVTANFCKISPKSRVQCLYSVDSIHSQGRIQLTLTQSDNAEKTRVFEKVVGTLKKVIAIDERFGSDQLIYQIIDANRKLKLAVPNGPENRGFKAL